MLYLLITLALLGFADATYLTLEHFMGGIIPCVTGGCETVTTSVYATIGPVPIALLGALYYLTSFLLLVYFSQEKKRLAFQLFLAIEAFSFVVSAVLVYLQIFVLKAICQYCVLSALITTLLFILGVYYYRTHLRVSTEGESA